MSANYIGAKPVWSVTNTSGFWTLTKAKEMKDENKWPRGPDAPTNLAATGSDAEIALTWTAPVNTYGSITNYAVEYTPAGGSPTVVLTNSASESYTVTGLTNDMEYTFRVVAINHTQGDYSAAVTGTPSATNDPSSVPGLFAWYDASDSTTRTLDPTYGRVKQWDDKSGNGYHLKTDSTLYVDWPQVTAAGQNGLDTIYFDNRPDLVTDPFTPIFTSAGHAVTIFIAFQTASDANQTGRALTLSSNLGTNRGYRVESGFFQSRAAITFVNSLTNPTYTFSSQTTSPTLLSVVQDGTGFAAYRDSVFDGSLAFSAPADSIDRIWVGAQVDTGVFKGSIYEIAVYTEALSEDDRSTIENYLMTKWGIA